MIESAQHILNKEKSTWLYTSTVRNKESLKFPDTCTRITTAAPQHVDHNYDFPNMGYQVTDMWYDLIQPAF